MSRYQVKLNEMDLDLYKSRQIGVKRVNLTNLETTQREENPTVISVGSTL